MDPVLPVRRDGVSFNNDDKVVNKLEVDPLIEAPPPPGVWRDAVWSRFT